MIIETKNAKYKLLCFPTTQDLEDGFNIFLRDNPTARILDYRFVVTSSNKKMSGKSVEETITGNGIRNINEEDKLIKNKEKDEVTKIGNFYLISIIYCDGDLYDKSKSEWTSN